MAGQVPWDYNENYTSPSTGPYRQLIAPGVVRNEPSLSVLINSLIIVDHINAQKLSFLNGFDNIHLSYSTIIVVYTKCVPSAPTI